MFNTRRALPEERQQFGENEVVSCSCRNCEKMLSAVIGPGRCRFTIAIGLWDEPCGPECYELMLRFRERVESKIGGADVFAEALQRQADREQEEYLWRLRAA